MACSLSTGLPVGVGEDLELGLLVAELRLVLLHVAVVRAMVDDDCAALLGSSEVGLLDALQDLLLLVWVDAKVACDEGVEIVDSCLRELCHSTAVVLGL